MADQPEASELFETALRAHFDVKAERDQLRDLLTALENDHALIADQLEGARRAIEQLSTQRDWYMRRCVELETQFTTFGSLVAEAMAKRVAKPHMPMTADDGEPAPKWLTDSHLREPRLPQ